MSDSLDEFRRLAVPMCRDRQKRNTSFSRKVPTHWNPREVTNPDTGQPFSDDEAWELIAKLLESGQPIDVIELDIPKGKRGYVMNVALESGVRVYIKLQMMNQVVGRSFHIDKYQ